MGNEQILALKGLWLNSIICQNKAPATAKEGNTPKKEPKTKKQTKPKKTPANQKQTNKQTEAWLKPQRMKERQLQSRNAKLDIVLELTACLRSERRFQILP